MEFRTSLIFRKDKYNKTYAKKLCYFWRRRGEAGTAVVHVDTVETES